MNNGANIVYLGSDELIVTPNDSVVTNDANRSELSRKYAIIKRNKERALQTLVYGYRADGYSNLYLQNPPKITTDATHCYFDCLFQGVLSESEGGRSTSYEQQFRFSNIANISIHNSSDDADYSFRYVQPGIRFSYTIPSTAEARITGRVIPVPTQVEVFRIAPGGGISGGSISLFLDGTRFAWGFYDLKRENYGRYDEVNEYWRLETLFLS